MYGSLVIALSASASGAGVGGGGSSGGGTWGGYTATDASFAWAAGALLVEGEGVVEGSC